MGSEPSENLVIRADAGTRIGTGHVMRCLALAQAWREETGDQARFVVVESTPGVNRRVSEEGFQLSNQVVNSGSDEDAVRTAGLAKDCGARWVVIDGYGFSGRFQQLLKDAGLQVLAVDDYGHAEHYHADLVLNQNLHAEVSLYRNRDSNTRLLLGPRFVQLRREFWPYRGFHRTIPETANRILVTLGGADPDNVTQRVIAALDALKDEQLEAVIVVGSSNPHLEHLRNAIRRFNGSLRIQTDVRDMAELMAWADLAVAAGGTTTWERALLGLPSLVAVLADNQLDVAESLDRAGLGRNLGSQDCLELCVLTDAIKELRRDAQARRTMAERGQALVDGHGGRRVIEAMRSEVTLRPATAEDCRQVWNWANEPATRAASFSTEPIPWEQHCRWFSDRLADPRCVFMIAQDRNQAMIGQVRCELCAGDGTISISLDAGQRGKGYAATILRAAASELFTRSETDVLHAYIRPGNEASIRAFANAGFKEIEPTAVKEQPARHFVLRRSQ